MLSDTQAAQMTQIEDCSRWIALTQSTAMPPVVRVPTFAGILCPTTALRLAQALGSNNQFTDTSDPSLATIPS
jgi:hypothetical protein